MNSWFARTFGEAIDDVRAKLIDEAWFSRRTAHPYSRFHEPEGSGERDQGQERDIHGNERGVDRDIDR